MNVVDQILILFAGTNGFLDKVPVKQVADWQDQFLAYMQEQKPEVRKKLAQEKKISKDLDAELRQAITGFLPQFKTK